LRGWSHEYFTFLIGGIREHQSEVVDAEPITVGIRNFQISNPFSVTLCVTPNGILFF
jgi:hypothetical protein